MFVIFSLVPIGLFVTFRKLVWASSGQTYPFGPLTWGLVYEMRKDLVVYIGITLILYAYQFILTRQLIAIRLPRSALIDADSSQNLSLQQLFVGLRHLSVTVWSSSGV